VEERKEKKVMRSVAERLFLILAILSVLSGCSLVRRWQGLTLAAEGESKYRIVIAQDAPEPVAWGAQELQRFLKEMSGAELPIVTDREPATRREILVGESNRFQELVGSGPGTNRIGRVRPENREGTPGHCRRDSPGNPVWLFRPAGRSSGVSLVYPRGVFYPKEGKIEP
jgi:uncharacterized protein YceK